MQRSHERAVMMCPASSSSPMRDVLVVRTRARTMLGFFLLRPAGGGGRRAAASVAGVEGVGRALSERARSRDAFMRGPKQPVVSSDHSLTRCGAWRAALQQQSARQFLRFLGCVAAPLPSAARRVFELYLGTRSVAC